MKAMIIGIDGGTWRLFDDELLRSHTPHLYSLKMKGFWGELRSTDPPITPSAWTTFITGCQPYKHGVVGFKDYSFTENRTRISSSVSCRVPTMFEQLSEQGYKIISINVPWTYPVREVNGIVVAGFGMPGAESVFTYPADFKEKLLSKIPDYTVIPDTDNSEPANLKILEENLRKFERCFEQKVQAARLACEQVEPDVMMVQFQNIDTMGHIMWSYLDSETRDNFPEQRDRIFKTLEKFDEALGDVLKLVTNSDAVVCVASDHGLCRLRGIIRPNVYLRDWGYLKFASPVKSIAVRLMRGLNRLAGKKQPIMTVESKTPLDWRRTKAMMLIPALSGHIYVNLENRNLKGSVKQGKEYEQILDELSSRFLELTGPDGSERLFIKAIRPAKLYDSENIDNEITADLILIPNDGYTTSDKVNKKTASMKLLPADHVGGSHRYEGMYIFNGPNVRTGEGPGHIVDIMPSIYALLGIELPDYIDGRPMQDIFRQPVDVKYRKSGDETSKHTRGGEALSSEQEEQIVKRLRALGYTE
jgi:predicted AlkP superfamily phosphohydrolase/phosphomutase